MATEIRVPALGESVTEATVGRWFKKAGEPVSADEPIVELETDKVTLEVNAPASGVLSELAAKDGETVRAGALLGQIGEAASAVPPKAVAKSVPPPAAAVRRASALAPAPAALSPLPMSPAPAPPRPAAPVLEEDREERVPMTRLRQTIARRLKDAQNTAAMLTTFNEVDMTHIMALRSQYREIFEKKHGAKLGFMGFFVRACVQALKEIPAVNAEIDGADIVYKNYYHIGIAVGTEKGLV